MYLSSLQLQHFRNYSKKRFEFSRGFTVIVGENAKGKTNILEAIALLSQGDSFRARRIEEMVQWGNEVGRAIGEIIHTNDEQEKIEVVVTTGMVQGERVQKRKYLVDDVSKRKKDTIGRLLAVVFRPEDLDLMTDGPSLRRSFLNTVLSQASRDYHTSLESYEKALKRRNALLDMLREGQTSRAAFAFWDQLMIKHGNILTDHRRAFIDAMNNSTDFPISFEVRYDSSTISEKRLHQYALEEVAAGHTLVGPHKDDFSVEVDESGHKKDIATYGSRGEQRMAVLWLKLQEMQYVEQSREERPMLLLDDIFSELDEKHQVMVRELAQQQQTIMTTADTHHDWGKRAEIISL